MRVIRSISSLAAPGPGAALVDDGELLPGLVEMDEAYVGGKPRRANRKDDHDPKPPGRGTSKAPVVGAVERGGRVKAKAVQSHELTGDDLEALAREMIDPRNSSLTTDEYRGYSRFNDFIAHRTVNHSREYVSADLFGKLHTNTIESFWAILKRAVIGQFHHVSRKYLPLYLREIVYRYNVRRSGANLDGVLHLAIKP